MLEKIIRIFKIEELRKKILFILAMLAIFRLAAAIPIPGINQQQLTNFFQNNQIFGFVNIFTGGAMSRMSIAMLGLGPYITSMIIMQLLTMIFPKLKEMYQESGEEGREKFNQYGRYVAVPLAGLQGFGFLTLLNNQGVITNLTPLQTITNITIITAGTMLLVWLGELISEKGIGNGISLLIFAGIIARLPQTVGRTIVTWDPAQIPLYVSFLVIAFLVIAGVVFITKGQRNIAVNYAKRVRGRKMYGGTSTYLPLKVNQAGVIPIIFALSMLMLPGMIGQFLSGSSIAWVANFAQTITTVSQATIPRAIIYFVLVVVFTYFYTAVTFDPENISENLQQNGGFIPGVRPGKPTAEYLHFIINRITLVGASFLGVIAILPLILREATGQAPLAIGGTAVLITVSVILRTLNQVESELTMRDYEGF